MAATTAWPKAFSQVHTSSQHELTLKKSRIKKQSKLLKLKLVKKNVKKSLGDQKRTHFECILPHNQSKVTHTIDQAKGTYMEEY